jgi:prepilin peptidase CpaA
VSALDAGLIAVVLVGVWTDVRTRRIPNGLTVAALLAALAVRAVLGLAALLDGVLGTGLAFALLLPLFALGGVGGGDAKLLVAVGAFLGPKGFLIALLATAVAGGVMSLVYAIRRGVILPVILNTGGLLKYVVTAGRGGERITLETQGALSVPYGVAIAAGAIFAVWFGSA